MGDLVIRHEIVREVVTIMIDRIAELEAENAILRKEINSHLAHHPEAWWAEVGTAGKGEGCNMPFWLKEDAIQYVRQHGGYIAPLYRAALAGKAGT